MSEILKKVAIFEKVQCKFCDSSKFFKNFG